MEVIVNDNNAKEFLATELPIVIDFSATWCGPCRQLAPVIDELAKEYDGRIAVGKCDIEEAADLTDEYNIRNVPTVIFIKNGEVVNKFVGSKSKADVQKLFEELLAK
ncbi:MAG: thioredoxin [Bacteroidaceae bacterium]|nr:thioredoxin [Bacteroidaceae bacterium]